MFGLFRFVGSLFFLALIAGVLSASWLLLRARAAGPLATSTLVVIEPGMGSSAIATRLRDLNAISSRSVFWASMALNNAWGRLQAGEYALPSHASANDIVHLIESGQVYQRKLTIPEGLTSAEIVNLLHNAEGLVGVVTTLPPEGSLLPETYAYTRGTLRQVMLDRMRVTMDKTITQLWQTRGPDFPLADKAQAITLASIVERETGQGPERPRVARVFLNRLHKGMKLQSDPTVIYALTQGRGKLDRPLTTRDLQQTDSPYNTYLYTGLPPAPIAHPGLAALRAVFHPASGDDLYFVADGTGGHAFATTLDAHNTNVARWRALMRDNPPSQP